MIFYTFFGWALQRGGQGPGKGPNLYVPIYPITLNDYIIYSPGKKIKKKSKK